jgi:hypothetical protein
MSIPVITAKSTSGRRNGRKENMKEEATDPTVCANMTTCLRESTCRQYMAT